MKNSIIIILLIAGSLVLITGYSAKAQYTQLVPSWGLGPNGSVSIPNYGGLLITIQNEVRRWADINCQKDLNSQIESQIEAARDQVAQKTTYLVIANITNRTDCKIDTFQPHYGGNPSAVSTPETKLIVYTIDIYPWIIVNGRKY